MDGSGPSTSGTGADGDAALAALLATSRAYKASKALNVAAKLDLFTLLHSHPQGAAPRRRSASVPCRAALRRAHSTCMTDCHLGPDTLQGALRAQPAGHAA